MNLESVLEIGTHIEIQKFDAKSYLIINNDTEKYLKINENLYEIINCIDGQKTIKEIVSHFNTSISTPISAEKAQEIFEKLNNIGLFSESGHEKKKKKLPPYLQLGFIFIPKSLVGKLVPYFSFLFNKKTVFATILFCVCFLSYLFYTSFTSNQTFNFLKIIPFFFLIKFAATMFHELGHASATHFYKAKHGGIGFGLYLYFMPVFFADVTDIWRLDKWKRIVVNVSGVYFEILFCGVLAVLSWSFNSVSLLAIASLLSITTLYNLLPYFRQDGYWVLSDLIDQPNLMITSFQKAKELILLKYKKFKAKDYFLALYGIFNFSMIAYFVGFMLIYHSAELLAFPKSVFHFFINISSASFDWQITDVYAVLPMFIVYFFGIRILISVFKKYILKLKTESPISAKSF